MYQSPQKKSSSWTGASIQKKSKSFSKPGSSAVQASRDADSAQSQDMPSYSTSAADLLTASNMRSVETEEHSQVLDSTGKRQSEPGRAAVAATAPPIVSIPVVQPNSVGIQAKLTVGAIGDVYEQEADRVAAQVMSMPVAAAAPRQVQRFGVEDSPVGMYSSLAQSITPVVHRRVDQPVQMYSLVQRAFQAGGNEASGDLESRLNASKGGGNALAPEVRAFMEPRFGADFSSVRVHTGGEALQMNRELGAQAFAHGSDIYFGAGKEPGNNELTAHELTHVVQQTGEIQTKFLSNQSTVQRKCPACEGEDHNPQESQLQAKETEQSSKPKPLIDADTEPDDPNAKLAQAIKIVQQALDASTGTSDKGGTEEAGSSDVEKQKQGLMTVLNDLHNLKKSGNVDEILKVTQPIFAAAKGDLETANQIQQQHSTQATSRENSTPTLQRFAQAAAAPALIGAGPVGWAILGIVGVATVGYLVYEASRSRPETQTIPRSSPRRRGVSCRCKARYTGGENPPDHCPKIVEGVGADNREAQKNAKWSAPEECRKFYGHCDCRTL